MSDEKFRVRSGFILREVAGEYLAISVSNTENPSQLIVLNSVSAAIWQSLQTEKNIDEIVREITSEFSVSENEAREDVTAFIGQLKELNLLV